MAENAYAEKAQTHNDITAAAGLLGDARRVENVEGGHYVTEFDGEGMTDADEITIRVSATVRGEEERTVENVECDLWGLDGASVEQVSVRRKSGFYAPVTHKNGFAQPARTPDEDADPEWTKAYAEYEVTVPLRGDDLDTAPTPIEQDRAVGAVPDEF